MGPQVSYLLGGKFENDFMGGDNVNDITVPVIDLNGSTLETYNLYEDLDIAGVFGIGIDTRIGFYGSIRTVISATSVINQEFTDAQNAANTLNFIENNVLPRYISNQILIGYKF